MDWREIIRSLVVRKRAIAQAAYGIYCRTILAEVGRNPRIDPSVRFSFPENIFLGNDCEIRQGALLIGRSDLQGGIVLADGVHIHQHAVLDAYGGFIKLGKGVRIGHFAVLCGHGGIEFDDFSGVAGQSYVIAANHGYEARGTPHVQQPESKKGIVVGRNVWGGAGVIITDGVTIGENSVIGAGSVIRRNVPANSVVMGNPATIAYRFRYKGGEDEGVQDASN